MEEEIIKLFQKYMDRQCDKQELEQVLLIIEKGKYQEEWEAALSNDAMKVMQSDIDIKNLDASQASSLNKRILNTIKGESKIVQLPKPKKIWSRIVVAASILLVAGLGLYFYGSKTDNNSQNQVAYQHDVTPGRNGATLTLANGQKILIDDAHAGNIANQSGVKISKTANGQIVYEITNDNPGEIAYNTLSTTRGEQTQVRLPDGTLVFLNAESSLKYPTSFTKLDKRQVSLAGEGYFEVAKDKLHPFVVNTKNQRVEVLGTHFNINSYSTKSIVKTTLLEGVVKVSSKNGDAKVLKPNQQAVVSSTKIEVKDVEAEYEIAWKEGFFMFNNESLQSIMDKVSRWYNVRVIYDDETLKNEEFIGTISKFKDISEILDMLKKTNVATFTINKDLITVKRINK